MAADLFVYPAAGGPALPVSIANGGTGQTTATAALNALGAGVAAFDPTPGNSGLTVTVNNATLSKDSLLISNTNASGQSFIRFKNSTAVVCGVIRSDFAGNMSLGAGTGGVINLYGPGTGADTTLCAKVTTTSHFQMGRRLQEAQVAVVASGSTLTLGGDGNYFHVSGTTTINYLTTTDWAFGSRVELYFDGALTLTHNAGSVPANTLPLRLVGATNASVAAGSKITLRLDSTLSQWVEVGRSGA